MAVITKGFTLSRDTWTDVSGPTTNVSFSPGRLIAYVIATTAPSITTPDQIVTGGDVNLSGLASTDLVFVRDVNNAAGGPLSVTRG